MALQIAKAAYDINPIIVDIDDEKLAAAKEAGASEVINSTHEDAAQKLMELTGGGARYIVDYVGAAASVNFGYNLLEEVEFMLSQAYLEDLSIFNFLY